MKLQLLLMIGAALILIVVTVTDTVGAPLGTLLLVGLLLLCPLLMVGMQHRKRCLGDDGAQDPSDLHATPGEGMGRGVR